ncbi:MAG: phosphotransacetylase family protein, partial [Leptolyngbyaceae bacterium]|nr:phosphotransacetylase family protein [Leptolyngbyaceae bacterium]
MANTPKCLLIGSVEAYSGKSATSLGLARLFQKQGLDIGYGKPIGTCLSASQADVIDEDVIDEDVRFIAQTLDLPAHRLCPTLLMLDETTIQHRLAEKDQTDYRQVLMQSLQLQNSDLILLEGPGTLDEGNLFDLSLAQIAEAIDAAVLLVARFHSSLVVDALLSARQLLGNRLVGVLINDIPTDQFQGITDFVQPFLEKQGIPVLGLMPRSDLLRSVSVRELVHQLRAEVLCRSDRLDLMVESLRIGAMNVNSALKYFQQARHMAVVTGGDRTEIQLAALETSTHCLILTGSLPPSPQILSRAEDLEIPILAVDLDTLATVEIINRAFGKVRLHEPEKLQCVSQMMVDHFDIQRLMAQLQL